MLKTADSKKDVKIGYALGGGGARGLSHIGVLKVLEEHNIFPHVIAGTSIGALIGALYASGLKAADVAKAMHLDLRRLALLVDVTIPFSGLVQGKRITALLKSVLGDLDFADLKIPFACVATDIVNGQQVVLQTGSVVTAVRASISIPGIFTPVRLGGRYLVDGGLVNMVPVSVCREMGAEYVVGVNVIPNPAGMLHTAVSQYGNADHEQTQGRQRRSPKKSKISKSAAPNLVNVLTQSLYIPG